MKKIWIYALACAMVAGLAACGEKPTVSPEDETPPHITPPEKPVEVKPTYPKDDGVLRLVSQRLLSQRVLHRRLRRRLMSAKKCN